MMEAAGVEPPDAVALTAGYHLQASLVESKA